MPWQHFIRDNYCLDSIILLYADITIYVYICIIRSQLFLYQWGKEPLSNRYMTKHTNISLTETCLTNPTQIGLCPHKVDLTAMSIAMFYNSAITLAAHDIYDQLIHFMQYNHTLWPCSCPCPTNNHVPHNPLIDRISHQTWLILSIGPAVTWYEYKVTD